MSSLLTSMLFVPGGDKAKVAKLTELAAPAFILDLEDAVADNVKAEARALVSATLRARLTEAPVWVRVNTQSAELLVKDLEAVVCPELSGVVLPKVRNTEDVAAVEDLLSSLEERVGVEVPIALMPTIENVEGLANVEAIAAASPRIQCLAFGAGDFSLDVGLDWPPAGNTSPLLIAAKCRTVLASRLAGIQPPHDGSYPLFRDLDGLRREAVESRDLGMFGKHAIHPGQVDTIDDVFAPDERQIARARRVLAAFDASETSGVANIDVDGLFVDYPVAARARQLLELADQVAAPL
jgi:citrate lyase subunit beta / citryl-CoA lyase